MDNFHLNRKWLCKRNLPTGRTETGLCEVWMRLNVLRNGQRARIYLRVLGLRLRVPPRCSSRAPTTDRYARQPRPSRVATRPVSTRSAMIRSSPGPPRRPRCKCEHRSAGTEPRHRGGLHRPGRRARASNQRGLADWREHPGPRWLAPIAAGFRGEKGRCCCRSRFAATPPPDRRLPMSRRSPEQLWQVTDRHSVVQATCSHVAYRDHSSRSSSSASSSHSSSSTSSPSSSASPSSAVS